MPGTPGPGSSKRSVLNGDTIYDILQVGARRSEQHEHMSVGPGQGNVMPGHDNTL